MEEVSGSIPLGSTTQNLRFKGGDFVFKNPEFLLLFSLCQISQKPTFD